MSRKNRKPPTNGNHRGPVKANEDDQLLDLVERKAQRSTRQPDREAYHNIWYSTVNMVSEMGPMPSFTRQNVTLIDDWCRKCLMREPFLMGFLSKITSAHANRGWSLYGGKRIVNATAEMLHRFDPATVRMDDGRVFVDEFRSAGWRKASKRKSLSFLTRNAGTFVEIQYRMEPRFTLNGWQLSAVTNLYNMDSSKVEYTGDPLYPIRYDGSADWPAAAYYHLVSSPFDTSEFYDYGLSPLYRCIRLAQLMVNISDWELGTLADDFVDSVLLLNGATDEEFNAAMKARSVVQANGNKAKRAAVMGSVDPSVPLTADVLHLREKPATLDDFTGRIYMLLQGYAVNLGYGLGHFMESPFGALLGRSGNEIDVAQRTTAEAGGNDYHLEDQGMLNKIVPAGIEFLYDEQDVDDRAGAEVAELRARTITELFLAQRLAEDYAGKELKDFARGRGNNLGTAEQFRQLMVDWQLVPPEWTENEEEVNVTDVEQTRLRERTLAHAGVQRFIHGVESGTHRDDAIVHYHYNPELDMHEHTSVVPSVKAMLDGQARTVVMGSPKPVERVSDTQIKQARRQLLKRREDAKAIAGVISG